MLARSKLRKSQQQKLLDGSVATMVSDESKVLTLDARVICSTDATRTVRMCTGCARREVISNHAYSLLSLTYLTIFFSAKELNEQKMANHVMKRT